MQRKALLLFMTFIGFSYSHALAANNSPIVFRQTTITIMSQREVIAKTSNNDINSDHLIETKKDDNSNDIQKQETQTIIENVAYQFKVNIRKQRKKEQKWLQHQINIKRDRGLLIQLEPTDAISLKYSDIYKKVDILLIRPTGIIDAIIPNTTPMDITDTIITNHPISTIIYLHATICKELNIMPNDHIKHDIFQPKLTILRN